MVSATVLLVSALIGLGPEALSAPIPQDTTERPAVRAAQGTEAVYRREKFVYPVDGRRNPFVSLIDLEDAGPQFENLDLLGVLFGGSAGSVASLIDRATDKRYRVRRGDLVGSARVVEIRPEAVVFQVTQFGVTRSETLQIRKEEEEQ